MQGLCNGQGFERPSFPQPLSTILLIEHNLASIYPFMLFAGMVTILPASLSLL